MRRVRPFIYLLCLLSIVPLRPAPAQEIKIGSIAPEQSPWGIALNRIAAEWSRISRGSVRIRVYHNGIAGNEPDMIRKVRIGQLQGVTLSSLGLVELSPDIMALSVPLLIEDLDELNAVFPKVRPDLDADIEKAGFKVISWSNAGWIRFFSKKPIYTPDDLKAQKLGASASDEHHVHVLRQLGYDAIPIPTTQTLTSLTSGMIDALFTSPLVAGGYQWFSLARHMPDLDVAPFMAAIVLSERTWRRIPAALRPALEASAEAASRELSRNIAELERSAIATMEANGLITAELTPEQRELWRRDFRKAYPLVIGTAFPVRVFDKIQGFLEEYRNR